MLERREDADYVGRWMRQAGHERAAVHLLETADVVVTKDMTATCRESG